MPNKPICYVTNTLFGKSKHDDQKTKERLEEIIDTCGKNNCHDIIVCGGFYGLDRVEYNNKDMVIDNLNNVVNILPKNISINYGVLSSYQEEYVLKHFGINLNAILEQKRKDIHHLGFDRRIMNDTLIYAKRSDLTNYGYNNGEEFVVDNRLINPSHIVSEITNDFGGNLIIIGGKNRFEEFISNSKYVIALPSITSPNDKKSPDIGYIFVSNQNGIIKTKEYVKRLSKSYK